MASLFLLISPYCYCSFSLLVWTANLSIFCFLISWNNQPRPQLFFSLQGKAYCPRNKVDEITLSLHYFMKLKVWTHKGPEIKNHPQISIMNISSPHVNSQWKPSLKAYNFRSNHFTFWAYACVKECLFVTRPSLQISVIWHFL